MSAVGDRLRVARARVMKRRFGRLARCQELQYLDIRVRDPQAANSPVPGARVTVTDAAGGPPNVRFTDNSGDVIFRLSAGTYNVEAWKEWYIPEPGVQNGVNLAANASTVVNINLEELRYYLHLDANRDGDVDDQHEGLNAIKPWQWGAGKRGVVILCNNDHDDALAVAARNPDNEDNQVNQNNDTNEIAPLQIRRVGPNTAPPAATNWTATLEILDGNEDKIRVFAGMAAGDAQVLGPGVGAAAAVARHNIALRVAAPGPASYPTTTFGMEATRYAGPGFNGLIRIKLTVSKQRQDAPAPISYYTAAEVRVAPWMMPNHLDEAHRVYVVDMGPDAGGGNQTFRNALNAALPAGINLVQQASLGDCWMQDCMEIGYCVFPKNTGAATRHRIEAVMQAHRDRGLDDLKDYPRLLLDADFGFHYPGEASAAAGFTAATAPRPGGSDAWQSAKQYALEAFVDWARAGHVGAFPVVAADAARAAMDAGAAPVIPLQVNQAAEAAATAVENAMAAPGSMAARRANMIADASAEVWARRDAAHLALDPVRAADVANSVGRGAAQGAANVANNTTTYDSGGNLECTPPCKATKRAQMVGGARAARKEYPWGRIYYGRGGAGQPFDARTREFLERQMVQLPIAIDTDWLEVGHVDEMMSFIPDPAGRNFRKWRLLLASPKRAYKILDDADPGTPMLQGRQLDLGGWTAVGTTVGALRSGGGATAIPNPGPAGGDLTADELRHFNLVTIQGKINDTETQLIKEIGVKRSKVIRVPVIFMPGGSMNVAGALTADMVNMLVVNNHCIVPKPFGPKPPDPNTDLFEADLRQQITQANPALNVVFVDDWYEYHANQGEVHCGTNTNRRPAPGNLNAWLGSEAAEWWRFKGG